MYIIIIIITKQHAAVSLCISSGCVKDYSALYSQFQAWDPVGILRGIDQREKKVEIDSRDPALLG